ncbi:DegV family protein [Carboxydothermus ferrireducens]|uniref:DegV family protein with EDD domain n=1 Tax=Carboxydothermus ferrireducens DSM 11255 TaxID=1119529 RepID=A0ABX2REL8_9THEO|nr:DegV family protein [Carboxydothermus ferrireducens]NYE58300.1 DegV family protein with EDD domain [Carboxydothermus ferrireducens DSM 11255]
MSKTFIVADSIGYLTSDYVGGNKEYLEIVPLTAHIGPHDFVDDLAETKRFYEILMSTKERPSTSQPPIAAFKKVFEEKLSLGYEIVCITISSKFSGTYNSALTAANEVGKDKIYVLDSKAIVGAETYLIKYAVQKAREGEPAKKIFEELTGMVPRMKLYFVPDSLEFLHRGGRIGGAAALFGSILQIKPVLTMVDGAIEVVEKIRTFNKAFEKLYELIPDDAVWAGVVEFYARDAAVKMQAKLTEKLKRNDIEIYSAGPVIGSHIGPGALGTVYLAKD